MVLCADNENGYGFDDHAHEKKSINYPARHQEFFYLVSICA